MVSVPVERTRSRMNAPTRNDGSTARFLWPIDVARFLFAALVALGHAYGFAKVIAPGWHVRWFDRVEPGGLWVTGFFVMSGWCIVAAEQGRTFDFARYTAARLTRVLPLYVVFLVLAFAAEAFFAAIGGRTDRVWELDPWTILAQLTMLQGLLGPFGSYAASWSLTHELFCYLLWGLLVVRFGGGAVSPAVLAWTAPLVVIGAIVHFRVHDIVSFRLMSLPLYFFIWMLGAVVGGAGGRIVAWRRTWPVRLAGLACVVGLVAYVLVLRVPETAGMLAFAGLLAFLALYMDKVGHPGPRVEAIARHLGLASYPLYLGHGVVLVAGQVLVAHLDRSVDPAVYMTVSFAAAVALSLVVGVPLERSTLAWRSRWLRRRAVVRAAIA